MTEREQFLRAFHAARPAATSRALGRTASYDRLAREVSGRVLELGCGDGVLLERLAARGCRAIGIDVCHDDLRRARGPVIQARAQELPFARASFDAAVTHLAFMLFDDVDAVVAELRRVVAPGGAFVALLGGGPTAAGDDAFHAFLALLATRPRLPWRLGDPRAKSEAGWRALFGAAVTFERLELVLDGSFDDVWAFLGASYELAALAPVDVAAIRDALAARCAGSIVPCRVVVWLARAVL